MTSNSKSSSDVVSDWSLSLDLLIARAALDPVLRSQLTQNPHHCCKANGISLPDDVNLVVTSSDKEIITREIPTILPAASFKKTSNNTVTRELAVFNGTTEYTETNTTTTVEAELTEAEAQTTTTTTTAEAEAEVVVVLT